MKDRTNDDRAEAARIAIKAYAEEVGCTPTDECVLSDLLADLRHWADTWAIDYEHEDARAQRRYQEEQ